MGVIVIGAGAAGLAAARRLADTGLSVLVLGIDALESGWRAAEEILRDRRDDHRAGHDFSLACYYGRSK